MKDRLWLWCPRCEQLCIASESFSGNKVICQQCKKTRVKWDALQSWECPNCGRSICGSADVIDGLSCPCGYKPASEPEPDEPQPEPEPIPEPEPEPELQLQCPVCNGMMKRGSEGYYCPVCKKTLSMEEVQRIQALSSAENAIKIFWDNAAASRQRIYVHPHSSNIPTHSVLIVGENQRALYQAAGVYYAKETGTYSLFWNELSEDETIASMQFGEQSKTFPIQLNTKIIFFDTRQSDHQYAMETPLSLYGAGYQFLPEVRYRLRIVDPKLIMNNSLNYGISAQSSDLENNIVRWANEAIHTVIANLISQDFQQPLAADFNPKHAVQNRLAELFDQHNFFAALTEKVNGFLNHSQRGIEIVGIDGINTDTGLTAEIPDAQAAACPECSTRVRKDKPGRRFSCPKCEAVMWYCTNSECGRLNFYTKGHFRRGCTFCGVATYFDN